MLSRLAQGVAIHEGILTQPALLQFNVIVIQNTDQTGWILHNP